MLTIDKGHVYSLCCLDGNESQNLIFVKRQGIKYPGNINAHSGTTTQEVLRACIERTIYVNSQKFYIGNLLAIFLFVVIIFIFEFRAALKHNCIPCFNLKKLYSGTICSQCGHIKCKH